LVKHSATWEARYFGEVFGRPFPQPLPRWDDEAAGGTDLWVTEDESREQIIGFYRRAREHADATIDTLAIDAPGHVPWWPRPDVKLFNVLVHILAETNRHAGHADILREQLDGAVGTRRAEHALARMGRGLLGEPLRDDRAGRQGSQSLGRLLSRSVLGFGCAPLGTGHYAKHRPDRLGHRLEWLVGRQFRQA
jgi:hypothetical protein